MGRSPSLRLRVGGSKWTKWVKIKRPSQQQVLFTSQSGQEKQNAISTLGGMASQGSFIGTIQVHSSSHANRTPNESSNGRKDWAEGGEENSSLSVTVSSPYWLLNKTSLSLSIGQEEEVYENQRSFSHLLPVIFDVYLFPSFTGIYSSSGDRRCSLLTGI